jgi:UDP-N-acetylglucosamine--N-acetylmuramyl-(pentapeptide) pyrophosphoryl-undecaprenol N-acetylglucosamine transferase
MKKLNGNQKTILFTGGGSAGHVTPNLPLIQKFLESGWHVIYVGSKTGMEKEIIGRVSIPYYEIKSGKLRRYFSWRTFFEPLLIGYGIIQSFFLCRKVKPKVVFSKGGFVTFPVVVGAWLNRIPVVVHESDLTPGLANRLSYPFARKVCLTFPEGKKFFKTNKAIITGTPIRDALFQGNAEKGKQLCHFFNGKPILLVMGGGQGAGRINEVIFVLLPKLLEQFQVVHICGKGKKNQTCANTPGYIQYEYLNDELPDIFACTDLVISRSGSNSLHELLSLKKPHILIPLSKRVSRGDQIHNAHYYSQKGLSYVLYEEELTPDKLLEMILKVYSEKEILNNKLENYTSLDSKQLIYQQLIELAQI